MRTTISTQPGPMRRLMNCLAKSVHPCLARPYLPAFLSALILAGLSPSGIAQQPAPSSTSSKAQTAHKPAPAKRKTVAVQPAPPAPVAPEPPKPPAWPVNDRPTAATVTWNSQGLRVEASNSSLQQVLNQVSTLTGTKIQGLGADQRIFGTYGPASARQVLSQLLDGSGYNVLMIGDQGQGTPRQILLSTQSGGQPPPQTATNHGDENADAADAEDQPQPEPQPAPPVRNGFAPGAPPRTPQQIMQEMQQRQQRNSPQF